jgi:RNA polymerase sigma factor (sigma-70 family)
MTGDPDSAEEFAAWVAPHLAVMGHLAAHLAGTGERDDIVQEALVRAWRKRHTFESGRGTPRSWLLAIVADRARRNHRRRRAIGPLAEARMPTVDPVDAALFDLEQAIAELPPRMRLAVDAVYIVGLTVAEAAAVMGVAEGTVKSTLAAARARLRVMLEVPS